MIEGVQRIHRVKKGLCGVSKSTHSTDVSLKSFHMPIFIVRRNATYVEYIECKAWSISECNLN